MPLTQEDGDASDVTKKRNGRSVFMQKFTQNLCLKIVLKNQSLNGECLRAVGPSTGLGFGRRGKFIKAPGGGGATVRREEREWVSGSNTWAS